MTDDKYEGDIVSAKQKTRPAPDGDVLETIRKTNRNAYTDNTVTGDYYYKYIGET